MPEIPVVTIPAASTARPKRPALTRRTTSYLAPPQPWQGAAMSPSIQVESQAIDYFYGASAQRRSWRAAHNLAAVVGGRCVVSLGLGGIIQAFIPGSLNASRPMPAYPGTPEHLGRTMFHPVIFALSVLGAVIGLAIHLHGVHKFYQDTSSINTKRAILIGVGGVVGALAVAGGGAQYSYATINQDHNATWQALPVRAVGNFLLFACLPNSFSSSELVHGQLPIRQRIWVRDIALAVGGAAFQVYSQISAAQPNPAPLYAREMTQLTAIIGVAIGAALPRVEAMNAQAAARIARQAVR